MTRRETVRSITTITVVMGKEEVELAVGEEEVGIIRVAHQTQPRFRACEISEKLKGENTKILK